MSQTLTPPKPQPLSMQDENGTLFDTDVPDIDGNAASIASGNGSTAAASSAAKAVQLESFSSSASFKYQGFICRGYV